jgi:hypothetical protein
MEAGIDEQNKRLTDIAERFERKDREMAMEQQDIVAKAEALLANVTPGPWEWWVEDGEYRRLLSGSADVLRINAWSDPLTIETEAADAAFIATAPELVRELLAEVKRLRASERPDAPHLPATLWGRPVVTEAFNIDVAGPIMTTGPISPLADDEQAALRNIPDNTDDKSVDGSDESEDTK